MEDDKKYIWCERCKKLAMSHEGRVVHDSRDRGCEDWKPRQPFSKSKAERREEFKKFAAKVGSEPSGLLAQAHSPKKLDDLSSEFDVMMARMQRPGAVDVAAGLLDATPEELGRAALAGARREDPDFEKSIERRLWKVVESYRLMKIHVYDDDSLGFFRTERWGKGQIMKNINAIRRDLEAAEDRADEAEAKLKRYIESVGEHLHVTMQSLLDEE